MKMTDMIEILEDMLDRYGDIDLENENGIALTEVDAVYTEDNHAKRPVAIFVK